MGRVRHDGRYAPSPSGPLHLGNLRTALLAWLFARSAGSRFVVRMEDLDAGRVEGAERASRAIYEGTLETVAGGVKTVDLGGHATTTEFTDAVVEKIRTKMDVWSSLGTSR